MRGRKINFKQQDYPHFHDVTSWGITICLQTLDPGQETLKSPIRDEGRPSTSLGWTDVQEIYRDHEL